MNYYEILGINLNAPKEEIRSAYYIKLRQYPAEFHPEMFQSIQQAYQVLKDEKKKRTYDMEELYGDEIEQLKTKATTAFDNEDYHEAKRAYKELLNYLPEEPGFLNMYAMSCYRVDNIDESIEYWKKATNLNDSNEIYHYNLGTAYEANKDYRRAVRCYKQAILCNPLEYEFVAHLSSLYVDLEDYENAWYIVETTMKKPAIKGDLKMVFLKRLVEVAILIKGQFEMKIAFKHIEKFIAENHDEKPDMLVILYNFSLQLSRYKNFEWAIPVIDFVLKHDPYDPDTKKIHKEIHENDLLYSEFDRIHKDEEILDELRYKIYLYLYSDELDEDEAEARFEFANEQVYEVCINTPSQVSRSIQKLKRYYPVTSRSMSNWISGMESLL